MIAVVTGAGRRSSGDELGPAVCQALDERGYSVVGWDADPTGLASTADSVRLQAAMAVDVADADAVARAFGDLDEAPTVVVNRVLTAADEARFAPFEAMTARDVHDQVAHALVGCSVVCLLALQRMSQTDQGAIVNVISTIGSYPAPRQLVNGAAAAAIESLTASLGAELGSSGIRVNAVAAAPIGAAEEGKRTGAGASPTRPRMSPEEIAAVIAFVGSPEAAAVSGAVVRADRGFDPFPGLVPSAGTPSRDIQ